MAHNFLYIIDPLERLNPATDTTLALLQEASARGINNYACELGDIFLLKGVLYFMAAPVSLQAGYTAPPTYQGEKRAFRADDFRVVFMRKDPPIDEQFWSALLMLRCYDPTKTLMINDPDGLLVANEKLFGLQVAPDFFPPTLVSHSPQPIQEFIKAEQKIVLKPLFGAGGSGVMVFNADDLNLSAALELLTLDYKRPVIVQSYIANARLGDKRILLLDGEPLGAVLRLPKEGDHRANFHAGGRAQATTISARDQEIISHLKPHLLALGLHLVGLDVIDGYLTEINVTSPTCLLEMEQLSGRQLRKLALDYIEQLIF